MKNTPEVLLSSEHMIQVTDLSSSQKNSLIIAISDLINLPASRLNFTTPRDEEQGLSVHLDTVFYGQDFDLFRQLKQWNLLSYSDTTPNIPTGKRSINEENENDCKRGEFAPFKIIKQVHYEAIITLHQERLELSNKIKEIVQKYLSNWCQFEATASGVSRVWYEGIKNNPAYDHLIVPALSKICEESQAGLKYDGYSTIAYTKTHIVIDWGKFEYIVQKTLQQQLQEYQIFMQKDAQNNMPIDQVAMALSITSQAIQTVQINDKNALEIIFYPDYQRPGFLQSMMNDLNKQYMDATIQDGNLMIPFSKREKFKNLVDNASTFCLLLKQGYAGIKEALKINKDKPLTLYRDVKNIYIKTDYDSQIAIYRTLKQNHVHCSFQGERISIPIQQLELLDQFIACFACGIYNSHQVATALSVLPMQISMIKKDYLIQFPSKKACDDFEASLKSLGCRYLERSLSAPTVVTMYGTQDVQAFITKQLFLLDEKKLEQYLLNQYSKAEALRTELDRHHNAPFNQAWLKEKFADQLIDCKQDFWFEFSLDAQKPLYERTREYLLKLKCGNVSLSSSTLFRLYDHAKWHIICAMECIIGNEIDLDKILNHDETIEKEIQNFLDQQKQPLSDKTKQEDSAEGLKQFSIFGAQQSSSEKSGAVSEDLLQKR